FTTIYALPDQSGTPTAFLIGWVFGLALIVMGWQLPQTFNILVLNILAMLTSLNAVLDLFYLTRASGVTMQVANSVVRNDAAAFSAEIAPLIPAGVWAFLWAGLALLMLAVSIYYSIIRPIRRGTF
ncbi:MAG TPA: hypothetical protein VHL11_00720, partial [Phototrophicaceae bacterium]|nr:hypothetical protein [Phototrophicaceae bacterium]